MPTIAKKVLITGASGFIGSFLVEEALRQNMKVLVGVRASSNLNFLQQPEISKIELNLSSPKELKRTFTGLNATHGGLDYVIHNAGATYARTKEEFYEINYRGTQNLVNALVACRLPLRKFIQISTLATYGPGDEATFSPIEVDDEEKPLSSYARSKQMADQCVRSIKEFPYLILKPTAVFGPRDRDFLRLFKVINAGFEFSLNNRQMISLIYVKDLTRVAIGLLGCASSQKTFLVSDGISYSKGDLPNAIREVLNKRTVKINTPLNLFQAIVKVNEGLHALTGRLPFLHSEKLQEMAATNWLCNSASVWKEIGRAPKYSLKEAVCETARWYKQNGWLS